MIYRDKIQVIEGREVEDIYGNIEIKWDDPVVVATISAQVDYKTTAIFDDQNRYGTITQLTAYCRPFAFDDSTQRMRWRGTDYVPDGPMRERSTQGRTHHVEIPLKVVRG